MERTHKTKFQAYVSQNSSTYRSTLITSQDCCFRDCFRFNWHNRDSKEQSRIVAGMKSRLVRFNFFSDIIRIQLHVGIRISNDSSWRPVLFDWMCLYLLWTMCCNFCRSCWSLSYNHFLVQTTCRDRSKLMLVKMN